MPFVLYYLLKLNGSSYELDLFAVNLNMLGSIFVDQVLFITDNGIDVYLICWNLSLKDIF